MRHITLRVLCEGQTELNFAQQVLVPHLQRFNVFAKAESFMPGNRFGNVPWEVFRRAIQADVGRSREHEFVTTMIDLYKIGSYPSAAKRTGESPYDRVERIEAAMLTNLPNARFIPYVQVHEFEALVLVDPFRLPARFPDGDADKAPQAISKAIGDTAPELVNDDHPPSKRIIDCVPAYAAVKSIAGPAIAAAIGLDQLRAKCPHFAAWITQIEHLS